MSVIVAHPSAGFRRQKRPSTFANLSQAGREREKDCSGELAESNFCCKCRFT